jgi:hypothetical protein
MPANSGGRLQRHECAGVGLGQVGVCDKSAHLLRWGSGPECVQGMAACQGPSTEQVHRGRSERLKTGAQLTENFPWIEATEFNLESATSLEGQALGSQGSLSARLHANWHAAGVQKGQATTALSTMHAALLLPLARPAHQSFSTSDGRFSASPCCIAGFQLRPVACGGREYIRYRRTPAMVPRVRLLIADNYL